MNDISYHDKNTYPKNIFVETFFSYLFIFDTFFRDLKKKTERIYFSHHRLLKQNK